MHIFGILLFIALIVADIVRIFKDDDEFDGIMLLARPIVVFVGALLCDGTFWQALLWAIGWGTIGFIVAMLISEHFSNSSDHPTSNHEPSATSISDSIDLTPSQVAALIEEAVYVINDMLEVGGAANIFSVIDYEGFICVVPDERPPFNGKTICYGFGIHMMSISELSACKDRYPRMRTNPENYQMIANLDRFAEKYKAYYDYAEERYVYFTKRTVQINRDNRMNLEKLLYEEVKNRCPLADFEGIPIHTKGVAH